MISEEALIRALDQSIVTGEQVAALRQLESGRSARDDEPTVDDEKLRFISGFGDIFVVIGLGFFLGASGYLASLSGGSALAWMVVAAASWLLAEVFTRRLRMSLPSIILVVAFAVSLLSGLNALFVGKAVAGAPLVDFAGHPAQAMVAAVVTAAAMVAHYRRFRVPVTVAAGIGAIALAALALAAILTPTPARPLFGWLSLVIGIAVFMLAMHFDRSDQQRVTRRTDIAFWLHFMAAPMIVHSLIQVIFGGISLITPAKAVGVIAVFCVLAVVALLVDRRAILVAALFYAGIAFSMLFAATALVGVTVPASLLVLGTCILALSAGWQPLRGFVLRLVPADLRRRLSLPHTGTT